MREDWPAWESSKAVVGLGLGCRSRGAARPLGAGATVLVAHLHGPSELSPLCVRPARTRLCLSGSKDPHEEKYPRLSEIENRMYFF